MIMKINSLSFVLFFCYLTIINGELFDEARRLRPLSPDAIAKRQRNYLFNQQLGVTSASEGNQRPYIGKQDGLKQANKISALPGQPTNVKLEQYSGYVTVNPDSGKALFYYFVESPEDATKKPLVLWLNGGPGCSSIGGGAFTEQGPFYINSDRKTLRLNEYGWHNAANMLFLESPIGVGFSYSNSTDDYDMTGDKSTTEDAYIFLLNWLERFPEYKKRDFFITGESYAGRYIPLLANHIVSKNVNNSIIINLKGVAIGNPYFDEDINQKGVVDFLYSRYILSKRQYDDYQGNCAAGKEGSYECYMANYLISRFNIDYYNIYAPVCPDIKDVSLPYDEMTKIDPCLENYTKTYLNRPEVQDAMHANVTRLKYEWDFCSNFINENQWHDAPTTMVPVVKTLLSSRLRTWIYSGDIDSVCPVIAVQNFFDKIGLKQISVGGHWYSGKEVAGLVTEYDKTTYVIVRGAGHMVPRDQPRRALLLFSSFLQNELPLKNPEPPMSFPGDIPDGPPQ